MSQSEPVHVLQIVTERAAANYATLIRHLCVGMIDEAISVTLISTTPKLEQLFVGPVTIVRHHPGRWITSQRSFNTLLDQISTKPGVIHCLAVDGAALAARLAHHYKANLVLQVAGFGDVNTYRKIRSENVAAWPAFTQPLADHATANLKKTEALIEVIRPGTHALKSPTCFTDPQNLPTVVVDCPLTAGCRLNDLLEAVARLIQENKRLMLFVLGTGPKETAFRKKVVQLKISSHVTFAGQVREWMKVLQGADIFVQLRPSTVFTISTIEAMAAGVAVIACPGGVEDYFHDDQTALLASPMNAEGFYRCLRRLVDEPGFARRLAGDAQEYVRTNHPPSTMASAYAQLYRRVLLKGQTFSVKFEND